MNAFSKTSTPRMRAIGITVTAASLVFVITSGPRPLSVASVDASLKRFGDYVATDTAKSGKEGTFTYGAIEIKGFWERFALVHDVNLQIKKQSLLESVAWSLSTPTMSVTADPLSSSRLYYVFNDAIEVKKNGNAAATITFSDPLKYGQMEIHHENTSTMVQNFKLPASITITPAQSDGGNVVITYDKNPKVEIRSSLEKPDHHALYEFHNVAVTTGNDKPLNIGAFKSELTEKTENNDIQGHYELNITALKVDTLPKPCDITADISYIGDQPLLKLAGMVSGSKDSSINVKQSALDCADFKITSEGTLGRSPEDPLPNGQINIKIEQVKQLLASNILSDQSRALLSQILIKVTGQPVDSLTNVEIPLKREKNGTFYIGDVTFEEIAAGMVANMFSSQGAAPQQLPVPETPVDHQDETIPDPQSTLLDPSPLPETPATNETPNE